MDKDKICSRCKCSCYTLFGMDWDINKWDLCHSCYTDDKNNAISSQTRMNGECSSENNIFCPYCGFLNDDDEFYESGDVECYDCEKKFNVEVEHRILYSTSKKGDEDDST